MTYETPDIFKRAIEILNDPVYNGAAIHGDGTVCPFCAIKVANGELSLEHDGANKEALVFAVTRAERELKEKEFRDIASCVASLRKLLHDIIN